MKSDRHFIKYVCTCVVWVSCGVCMREYVTQCACTGQRTKCLKFVLFFTFVWVLGSELGPPNFPRKRLCLLSLLDNADRYFSHIGHRLEFLSP